MNFKFTKNNLNFKVYTAAETPATGAENDIVVISATPMKNWVLSPDEPTNAPRNDGDVWIRYAVDGADFNSIKQNTVMVRFVTTMQYVNGAWVGVVAKSYQNGVWVDWFTGLLGRGLNRLGEPSFEIFSGPGALAEASFKPNSDGSFSVHMTSSGDYLYAGCVFPNKVSLSEYSSITVKYVIEASNLESYSNKFLYMELSDTPKGDAIKSVEVVTNKTELNKELTATVDVSTLNEVYLRLYSNFDQAGRSFTVRIIEIIPE